MVIGRHGTVRAAMTALGLMTVLNCGGSKAREETPETPQGQVINFDLEAVGEGGLVGLPDGLRALSYEFCIPARPDAVAEVRSLDPTIETCVRSPGRIGCSADELLCIGHTNQPGWRQVLVTLAELEDVDRIDEWFGE